MTGTIRLLTSTVRLLGRLFIWLALPRSLSGLEPAPAELQAAVSHRAARMGIHEFDVLVSEDDVPNAIPVGTPSGAVVVLTSGLLDRLDDETVAVVILHELAHVKLGHERRFAGALAASIAVLVGVHRRGEDASRARRLTLLAPVAVGVLLALLALSRSSVRAADRIVIEALDSPEPLARAIVVFQTGDSSVDPREYDAPTSSRVDRLLGVYPATETRLKRMRR